MKLLLEDLINPNTPILSDTQKAVLVMTVTASSPQMAFSSSNKARNLVAAREALRKLDMVEIAGNSMSITDNGQEMLEYHNLVDDMGEITDEAREILDSSEETGDSFNNQEIRETFNFLKSII